jgi:hypothetical protein
MDDVALDIVRVLVTNGARPETDIALAMILIWCGEAGFDEEACLQGLGRAAGAGWITGIRHFELIRVTRAGAAAVKRSTH